MPAPISSTSKNTADDSHPSSSDSEVIESKTVVAAMVQSDGDSGQNRENDPRSTSNRRRKQISSSNVPVGRVTIKQFSGKQSPSTPASPTDTTGGVEEMQADAGSGDSASDDLATPWDTIDRIEPSVETRSPDGKSVCVTTKRTMVAAFNENILLDPTTDIIWPGAIVMKKSVENGTYVPVPHQKDSKLTLSISIENMPKPRFILENPSLANYRSKISEQFYGFENPVATPGGAGQGSGSTTPKSNFSLGNLATPTSISFESQEIFSQQHLRLAAQASFNANFALLSGLFDFSKDKSTKKLLVRFIQKYYTIDVSEPPKADNSNNEEKLAYISSVSYGRMILFAIETDEDTSKVSAAFKAVITGYNIGASGTVEQETVLRNSNIKALVLGANAKDGIRPVVNGFEGVQEYLQNGANWGVNSPGVPLSYKLRMLDTNEIFYIQMKTEFSVTKCTKLVQRYGIKLKSIRALEIMPGEGNAIELYGTITFSGDMGGSPVPSGPKWKLDRGHISVEKGREVELDGFRSWVEFPDYHKLTEFSSAEIVISPDMKDEYIGRVGFFPQQGFRMEGNSLRKNIFDIDPNQEYELRLSRGLDKGGWQSVAIIKVQIIPEDK